MDCPHCGELIRRKTRFCPHCGKKLGNDVAADEGSSPKQKIRGAARSDESLPDTELWHGRYSKFAMVGAWTAAGVLSVVSLSIGLFGSVAPEIWLGMIGLNVLVWLSLVGRYLYLRFSRYYVLSNQRFSHMRGLLWRQVDRIEVIDIDDVSFTQGPVERIFGIGTVRISSSDHSHPELTLPGTENVQIVAGMIDDARRKERRRRGLYIESV